MHACARRLAVSIWRSLRPAQDTGLASRYTLEPLASARIPASEGEP